MRKYLFLVPLLFFWSIAGASISADHLVISQFQITGGSGKTGYDFVEINNPTSQPIDLKGIRLVKRTATGTTDTLIKSWTDSVIIPPGGYYLWANSSFTELVPTPDIMTSGTLANDNGIALRSGPNDTGTIIDSVAWGTVTNIFVEGAAFATNPEANKVLQRISDTGNNSADFVISDPNPHNLSSSGQVIVPPPTPQPEIPDPVTTAPTETYSRDIIISEILSNPDGKDDGEEWVELFNNSEQEVSLGSWILDDGEVGSSIGADAYIFADSEVIKGKSYLVVKLSEENFSLANSGEETVRLYWPDKTLITSVKYTGTVKIDESYAINPNGLYVWTNVATPGTVNKPNLVAQPKETPVIEETKTILEEILPNILITEIFPEPSKGSSVEEYIELFNAGDTEADLTGFVLADKATKYKLEVIVPAGGFVVVYKSESKLALNNSGIESVTLTSPVGTQIDAMEYENAPSDQSLNLRADESYSWSTELTPGKINIIKIKSAKKPAVKKSVVVNPPAVVESEPEEEIFVEEAVASSQITAPLAMAAGEVSGAMTEAVVVPMDTQPPLWPWLLGSFAANLVFCYSLVRLMTSPAKRDPADK